MGYGAPVSPQSRSVSGPSPDTQASKQLEFVLPTEDAGSETANRYEFQYDVAARHCCEMLRNGGQFAVLCEWHTDFVIIPKDDSGKPVLVSVKHRERRLGRWTTVRLCDDGGLKTLRERWIALGEVGECRLATNGSLDVEAASFAGACAASDRDALQHFAHALCVKLGCAPADALQFFLALRIESELPERKHIRADNVDKYMRPLCTRSRFAGVEMWDAYDRVVRIVRDAARDFVSEAHGGDWLISVSGSLDASVLTEETIKRRTIDIARIMRSFEPPANSLNGEPPLLIPSTSETITETRLIKKLRRGGIRGNTLRAARRTRRTWTEFEAKYRMPLPLPTDVVEDLRTRVLHAAGVAESKSQVGADGHYGPSMLHHLMNELRSIYPASGAETAIDKLHLLGLAYQLTDECEVWWSEEFDVDSESA